MTHDQTPLFDRKPWLRLVFEAPLVIIGIVMLCILIDHVMDEDARNLCAQGDVVSEDVCRQAN